MTVVVKDVPLAKLPHALRSTAHSLSSYLRSAGVEPEDLGEDDGGCFICPFCAQDHPLLVRRFHGGRDPATGEEGHPHAARS